jgi:hypothetical protein
LLDVIHRGLVLIAVVCCGLVSISFIMFARDQIDTASLHQQALINDRGLVPGASKTPVHHAQPTRFIDSAAGKLTSPFSSLVRHDSSLWVKHVVPTLFALLLYGVGLGYLARYSSGMARARHRRTRPADLGL